MTIETPNTTIEADHFHVPKSTQRLHSSKYMLAVLLFTPPTENVIMEAVTVKNKEQKPLQFRTMYM